MQAGWGRSRCTVVGMWNTGFTPVILWINYGVIFHQDCKPTFAPLLYATHQNETRKQAVKSGPILEGDLHSLLSDGDSAVLGCLTIPDWDVPHTQTGTHLQGVTNRFLPPAKAKVDLENGYYSENLQECYLGCFWGFEIKALHTFPWNTQLRAALRCSDNMLSLAWPLGPQSSAPSERLQPVHGDSAWVTREPEGRNGTQSHMCQSGQLGCELQRGTMLTEATTNLKCQYAQSVEVK